MFATAPANYSTWYRTVLLDKTTTTQQYLFIYFFHSLTSCLKYTMSNNTNISSTSIPPPPPLSPPVPVSYEYDAAIIAEFYLPKIAAILSICGSSILIMEVLKDRRSCQGTNTVSRILLSMSIGDILFSFSWFLGSWVSPSDLQYLHGTNHGTTGTCTFQGFVMELGGLASLFFNASLAVIYYLSIRRRWNELQINQLGNRLQLILWIICICCASIPIPFQMYNNAWPVCWIDSYPTHCYESWELGPGETSDCTRGDNAFLASVGLQILPILGCVLMDSVIMCNLYGSVRSMEHHNSTHNSTQQDRTVSRNETNNNTEIEGDDEQDEELGDESGRSTVSSHSSVVGNDIQRSSIVARQGLWYIAGFLLTFGLTTISGFVFLITGSWNKQLDLTSYFFVALAGFWNFLVFSRRRTMKTRIGQRVRALFWGGCCCCRPDRSKYPQQQQLAGTGRQINTSPQRRLQQQQPHHSSLPPINEQSSSQSQSSRRTRFPLSRCYDHVTASEVSPSNNENMKEETSMRWQQTKRDGKPLRPIRAVSQQGSDDSNDFPPILPPRVESELQEVVLESTAAATMEEESSKSAVTPSFSTSSSSFRERRWVGKLFHYFPHRWNDITDLNNTTTRTKQTFVSELGMRGLSSAYTMDESERTNPNDVSFVRETKWNKNQDQDGKPLRPIRQDSPTKKKRRKVLEVIATGRKDDSILCVPPIQPIRLESEVAPPDIATEQEERPIPPPPPPLSPIVDASPMMPARYVSETELDLVGDDKSILKEQPANRRYRKQIVPSRQC